MCNEQIIGKTYCLAENILLTYTNNLPDKLRDGERRQEGATINSPGQREKTGRTEANGKNNSQNVENNSKIHYNTVT